MPKSRNLATDYSGKGTGRRGLGVPVVQGARDEKVR